MKTTLTQAKEIITANPNGFRELSFEINKTAPDGGAIGIYLNQSCTGDYVDSSKYSGVYSESREDETNEQFVLYHLAGYIEVYGDLPCELDMK
jgi:hypothetical protein